MATDPKNSDLLYIVTGEPALVYRSSDGGYSWSQSSPLPVSLIAYSMQINPTNPRVLLLGTDAGLLRSDDGGDSWKFGKCEMQPPAYDLAIDPIGPDVVYAAFKEGVARSTDGGTTWSPMNTGLSADTGEIHELAINPLNPQVLYAATDSGVYSYNYVSIATELYFPRLATRSSNDADPDNSECTGIALVNLDSVTAELTLTAYGTDGTLISGSGITNPAVRTLKAGAQLPITDAEIWGVGLPAMKPVGWFKVESTAAKVAGFFMMFNSSLTFVDGADASSRAFRSWLFSEIEPGGFTQIHVANPYRETANVHFELVDRNGNMRATSERGISPNGALVEDLDSLFPAIAYTASDYLRVRSEGSVIPFESMGKAGRFIQGLNGQDSSGGALALYSPQYVVGGTDWRTTLSIVNPSSMEATAVLRLIGDNGVQIGATRTLTIPAGGKAYIDNQDFFLNAGASPVQGYVEITSTGPSQSPLLGSVSFGDPERNRFATALPLVPTLMTEMVFSQVASNATWFTGLAILNPGDSDVTATLRLLDRTGTVVRTKNLVIPAGQRISRLLSQQEYFADLAGTDIGSGYIHIVADKGIAAFAVFGTNNLSAVAAVPPQLVR